MAFGQYALRRKSHRRKERSPKVCDMVACFCMEVSMISVFGDLVFGDEVHNRIESSIFLVRFDRKKKHVVNSVKLSELEIWSLQISSFQRGSRS